MAIENFYGPFPIEAVIDQLKNSSTPAGGSFKFREIQGSVELDEVTDKRPGPLPGAYVIMARERPDSAIGGSSVPDCSRAPSDDMLCMRQKTYGGLGQRPA